jgi:hypothetical protein
VPIDDDPWERGESCRGVDDVGAGGVGEHRDRPGFHGVGEIARAVSRAPGWAKNRSPGCVEAALRAIPVTNASPATRDAPT